ncbi:MAG: N-acetyl-gamma-glutamyl-phosphate reductase [Planctomycetes bacterium]|jgi:N-acetyl-gamma-glutamyl-phosphate reductase|nr:N-acetyl-gamma-glutamyl-phosphate reductase [Planctomycetota bacterium]
MDRIRAAIVGGSGYGGGELLRLLAAHPFVEVVEVTAQRAAGKPVHAIHENLLGTSDLVFTDRAPPALAREVDVLFFALPHGEAAGRMREVFDAAPPVRVIDLSGDFRLRDPEAWAAAYGKPHPAPDLLASFVYGCPEAAREEVRAARRVANPGCFATGAILALLPLARSGRLEGRVAVNGVTGSSGSGTDPKPGTHHPERAADFRAYRPLVHQHVPEIEAALRAAGARGLSLAMVPHSGPFVRGIFTTAYFFPASPLSSPEVAALYRATCEGEPFLRLRSETPRVGVVCGTNYGDLSFAVSADGRTVVCLSAIDNLVKGMAGQAIQNLNLMFGLEETAGLRAPGMHP